MYYYIFCVFDLNFVRYDSGDSDPQGICAVIIPQISNYSLLLFFLNFILFYFNENYMLPVMFIVVYGLTILAIN